LIGKEKRETLPRYGGCRKGKEARRNSPPENERKRRLSSILFQRGEGGKKN